MQKADYSFSIKLRNEQDFFDHWSSKYKYSNEYLYENNIGRPLTRNRLLELFEWKNGTRLSAKKETSIITKYPVKFVGNAEEHYLNPKASGGAIWNIFYLHLLDQTRWPIFDQHVFRAMHFLEKRIISEIPKTNAEKSLIYQNEYIPFFNNFSETDHRKKDKALFSFGQFLKAAKKYV